MSKNYQVEDDEKIEGRGAKQANKPEVVLELENDQSFIFFSPFADRNRGGETLERQKYYEKCILSCSSWGCKESDMTE